MRHRTLAGGGWVPERHDPRDLTADHPRIRRLLARGARRGPARRPRLPRSVDLRKWCGAIHFQGGFPTCNAHAVSALVEYFERRAFGESVEPSVRFLYRVAENLVQATEDGPVYIRQVMGALKLVGVPPAKFWPYPQVKKAKQGRYPTDDPALHQEPTAFCYAVAADYRSVTYYRLDARTPAGALRTAPARLLSQVKRHLATGIPTAFGFPLFAQAVTQSWKGTPGLIPFPGAQDTEVGGHAVVAVGYDDGKRVRNLSTGAATTGALLLQNSWGVEWGDQGFGWLPFEYLLQDRARDFWTLTRAEWIDTGQFQLGLVARGR